ncbi:annexin A4-like [Halichondria panicea]|uniref:annexin A4-like n=1 Tax=Halichondria panicea TaxID=6063 RepID=UPI00312B9A5C
MSYPGYPPAPGGYPPQPGYPPQGGSPYPPGPPAGPGKPWVPGGPSPGQSSGGIGFNMPSHQSALSTGYPPTPQGGFSGSYHPPGPPQPSYPPVAGRPGYPPGPPASTGYPPGPPASTGYPPGPPASTGYPPGPPASTGYPPGPPASTGYPSGPPTSTNYPPGPPGSSYPPGPPSYPPGGGYTPQYGTGPTPLQQTPRGYSTAPPPVPSAHTHRGPTRPTPPSVASTTQAMAAISVKEPKTEGTVKPHRSFDAENDASVLRKAMKGLGTDEKAIISVLAHRSNTQRMEIITKFKSMYGKDLVRELKSELSGNFEDAVVALLKTPSEYDAFVVREAIKGVGTDEHALVEILCTRTNEQILAVKEQYKKDYGRDLERDVVSDTSGNFKRLLVSMLTGARDAYGVVDKERARADAQALYQAGEARWGTDESKFNHILASRSFSHLRMVFDQYSKICKYDIEQSISREMSGDLKEGMLAIVKCVRDRSGYFAEALYKSMKGLGTDDRTLVRVVVTRCEVDMVQIKHKFQSKYHKTLGSFIKGDTSGDYRRILMALAGEDH